MSDKYSTLNGNVLSRLRNSLAKTITEQKLFPKFIVVVPDVDIMTCFDFGKLKDNDDNIRKQVTKVIQWLVTEFGRLVELQKEYLPSKAKKPGYPTFICIAAPSHKNFRDNPITEMFNDALEAASLHHDNVSILALKKIWDPDNDSLFLHREQRFTSDGYRFYWEAINKTVRYADTIQFKKMLQKKAKCDTQSKPALNQVQSKVVKVHNHHPYDWLHWHNKGHSDDRRRVDRDHHRYDRHRR